MRKLVLLTLLVVIGFATVSIGQSNDRRAYTENRSEHRSAMREGNTKCHKGKKYHKRQMRKMAAADGKITPRERKMLRRDRRHTY